MQKSQEQRALPPPCFNTDPEMTFPLRPHAGPRGVHLPHLEAMKEQSDFSAPATLQGRVESKSLWSS